jgi:flagellar protein FlbT
MALKVSLKPGEKFVVNGAVIINGDRRSTLIIQNKVTLLREKDIITEEEVNTPVKRIYFPIMLMYLDGESKEKYKQEFLDRMSEFLAVISDPDAILKCVSVSNDVMGGNYYRAMNICKKLITFEEERLGNVP